MKTLASQNIWKTWIHLMMILRKHIDYQSGLVSEEPALKTKESRIPRIQEESSMVVDVGHPSYGKTGDRDRQIPRSPLPASLANWLSSRPMRPCLKQTVECNYQWVSSDLHMCIINTHMHLDEHTCTHVRMRTHVHTHTHNAENMKCKYKLYVEISSLG